MTDIRKFFPTDKQKQKTKPTKNSKFLDDDEDDFIPVNPTKKNKSKKKKNKNRNKSDLKSLTEPIKPDKNLTFSLPTGLCFSVNAQYQDKTKLSDQPEDIDDEDEKRIEEEEEEIHVGEKRKEGPNGSEIYVEWKRRHVFRSSKSLSEQTTQKQIEKQRITVQEWENRLEYYKKQMEKVQKSLEIEQRKLDDLYQTLEHSHQVKSIENGSSVKVVEAPVRVVDPFTIIVE